MASLAHSQPGLFGEIARVVFEETGRARRNLHAARGALRCDASYRLAGGLRTSGGCPCVDEYVDAVVEVWRYLEHQDPAAVGSYAALARTHCRLRVVKDLQRQRRGARSQQRTDRLADGAIGRALSTPAQRALLRHLVEEAASSAPLEDQAQLLHRLALRRAAASGQPAEAAEQLLGEVARDLRVVRQAAITHGRRQRDSAGMLVSWWEHYVETGLGWRERLSTVPVSTTAIDETPGVDVADHRWRDLTETAAEAMVVRAVVDAVQHAPQQSPVHAIQRRLLSLSAQGVLPPGVVRCVLSDPQRLQEVARAARELVDKVA
jgi:hypothetical protein